MDYVKETSGKNESEMNGRGSEAEGGDKGSTCPPHTPHSLGRGWHTSHCNLTFYPRCAHGGQNKAKSFSVWENELHTKNTEASKRVLIDPVRVCFLMPLSLSSYEV